MCVCVCVCVCETHANFTCVVYEFSYSGKRDYGRVYMDYCLPSKAVSNALECSYSHGNGVLMC